MLKQELQISYLEENDHQQELYIMKSFRTISFIITSGQNGGSVVRDCETVDV